MLTFKTQLMTLILSQTGFSLLILPWSWPYRFQSFCKHISLDLASESLRARDCWLEFLTKIIERDRSAPVKSAQGSSVCIHLCTCSNSNEEVLFSYFPIYLHLQQIVINFVICVTCQALRYASGCNMKKTNFMPFGKNFLQEESVSKEVFKHV